MANDVLPMPGDWGASFAAMPDADAAALIRAAYAYMAGDDVAAPATPTAAAFWPLLKSALDRIRTAHEGHVEQRRAAARSRWEKKTDAEKCGDHAETCEPMRADAEKCGDHAETMRTDAHINVNTDINTAEKETPLTGSKEKDAFSLTNAKKGGFKRWTQEEFAASVDEAIRKQPDLEPFREEFVAYWTEPDTRGRPRYQLEKTWQTAGRLATWRSRAQSRPVVKLRPAFNAADPSTWGGE